MKKGVIVLMLLPLALRCYSWGFYAHKLVNYYAVFMLPPEMLVLYKPHIEFLKEHAVDPDKRRYAVEEEGARHYIDMDLYGTYVYDSFPVTWRAAIQRFGADSLSAHGLAPWWIQTMLQRLTTAFREHDRNGILKLSADIGHYISDAHVPLHATSNYNGQKTGQIGIHGFWESRIPELLAETEWDFLTGRASYIKQPLEFTWRRVMQSAKAADSVLLLERRLNATIGPDSKFAYESRNGLIVKQYSAAYCRMYNKMLNGMVERRFRESVQAVASFWYTAWVDAGQPDLKKLAGAEMSTADFETFEELNYKWMQGTIKGKSCD